MSLLVLRRSLLGFVFILGSACSVAAQLPMPLGHMEQDTKSADVREVVSKYCRLDYEGARLDGQSWPKVEPLVSWKTNPEYSQISVISRYTVDPEPASSHGKYTVTVHYRLLGSYDLGIGYERVAANSVQDVEYTVTGTNGEWRISGSDNNLPHTSRAAMLKWLNEKLSTSQDEPAKTRYQEALRQLQAQSVSPFAK
ncbi:MAG TPA: hypothetical protein VKG65_03060 [Terriglobales bacterium]|nr:hypothetical protein [Terriglobales bacterium]